MTYDQIVTLTTIVEQGSFKAASLTLAKSQPALSVAIKKLEEEFHIQIFDRSDYRPVLTEQGRIIYQKAKENIHAFQQLEKLAIELGKGVEPKIKLSLEAIVPIQKIAGTLSEFNKTIFATELEVSVDIIEGAVEKVIDGEVDLAIGPLVGDLEQIEAKPLFQVCMIPVMTSDNELIYMATKESLKQFPQLVVRSTSKHRSDNGAGLLGGGKKWYLGDNSLKREMIMNGLGWGKLPLHSIENELTSGYLIEIPFEEVKRVNVKMYLMKNINKPLGPNTKKLWNELLNCGDKND